MAKKDRTVTKNVTDFNVAIYDNGFTLTYSGNNDEDDWTDAKLIVPTVDQLVDLIKQVVSLPRA